MAAPHSDRVTQALLATILIGIIALGVLLVTGRLGTGIGPAPASSFELGALALLLMIGATAYLLGRMSGARSKTSPAE